jgi:hypothetical protein
MSNATLTVRNGGQNYCGTLSAPLKLSPVDSWNIDTENRQVTVIPVCLPAWDYVF